MGNDSPNKQIIWRFLNVEYPKNGWLMMRNPIEMDDLGAALF